MLKQFTYLSHFLSLLIFVFGLVACGGGSAPSPSPAPAPPTTVTSFELLDPTPGTGNLFGQKVVILANGNIVVSAPLDDSVAQSNGAVHLYNPLTQTRIASFYGDTANDQLGSSGITALTNNNFVISTGYDDVDGIVDAGSVMLVNGATGVQVGSTITGDTTGDRIGFSGLNGVTVLANNNFVIVSKYDVEGGIVDAGSARLVNGTTGAQIGNTIAGDTEGDFLFNLVTARDQIKRITTLANNNFVIALANDDEGGIVDAGSVRLVNGTTGIQIGGTIAGDTANDYLGSKGITALANDNFVIVSQYDHEGGITDAGSVKLVNGTTGVQIGSTMAGDSLGDFFGSGGVTALANNYFVIASDGDTEGGILNTGSVRLMNGTTGDQIGGTIAGNTLGDSLGSSGITALANNNFVIASEQVDKDGIPDVGSVRLVNGTTGDQIGNTITGNAVSDRLGRGGVIALANNNFVIVAELDDENGIDDAGSIRLVDGTTGTQIGSTIAGDAVSDRLGISGITVLANNNFVIVSEFDDENGIVDAGSVRLVNGTTGAQIGSTLAGDALDDSLGFSSVTALANNNFVIISEFDDEGGIVDAGSVRVINGATGAQIDSTITGSVTGDMEGGATVIGSSNGDFYILSLPRANSFSGLVRLITQ